MNSPRDRWWIAIMHATTLKLARRVLGPDTKIMYLHTKPASLYFRMAETGLAIGLHGEWEPRRVFWGGRGGLGVFIRLHRRARAWLIVQDTTLRSESTDNRT